MKMRIKTKSHSRSLITIDHARIDVHPIGFSAYVISVSLGSILYTLSWTGNWDWVCSVCRKGHNSCQEKLSWLVDNHVCMTATHWLLCPEKTTLYNFC
ncbi:hypothetical protein KQX54_004786 [Cotesia glomerata]|uniref:Uncharacterized protein n=1 Tax=Cotesia glomerata TaxID=32391 RepID=A0AAV7I3N6_COTGL|nr:hypothetical protein KQX54_004786 [Cotesia glomerata]